MTGLDGTPRRPPATVSVVIPVRDGAEVLHRQLDALAAQTYAGSWEVVIADNGSTDGSAEVAMRWGDRLPGLRVVDASARRGVGPARNRGCEASTAEAVLFCDADDEAAPEWLASMVAALADHPIVGGPCRILDPDGHVVPEADKLGLTLGLIPFPVGANFGAWHEVFDEVGGFEADHPEAQAEDAEFCLRAWELGHAAGFAPNALMTKSRRPDVRSTYRQWKGYGAGAMFNVLRFRDRGTMPILLRSTPGSSAGCSSTSRWCAPGRGGCDGSGGWRPRSGGPPATSATGGCPSPLGPPVPGHLSHPLRRVLTWRWGAPDRRRAHRSTASTSRPTPPSTASIP